MYTRWLPLPERSFFLFGPRGTGKTTWLRQQLPNAHWFDLVKDHELLRIMRDPETFGREVESLPRGSFIVIDEVQRLPSLLNQVQDLITRFPGRYRFALTGSSARRLRREQANLLPSRVINRKFFPLTHGELGEQIDVDEVLRFGMLPAIRSEPRVADQTDLLEAYADNYVSQEIRAEAGVKRLEPFTRFLQVAALANAQVTNTAGIARDAAVARPTVQGYFEVLSDTLIGTWLPAWRARAKIKEVAHPKFYLFDTGVARALAGRLREPLERDERGHLLETYLLHELRAWLNLSGIGGQLSYWRTPSGSEIDFVWSRGKANIGIEVKSTLRWQHNHGNSLRELLDNRNLSRALAVYLGPTKLKDGKIDVFPLFEFLNVLYAGKILS